MPQSAMTTYGSSPHTRGARRADVQVPGPPRIIPAYAGSTAPGWRALPSPRDHPRIRGEHRPVSEHCQMAEGSSPHTRGARKSTAHPILGGRIIPAYAGSTHLHRRRHRPGQDHPRIRGEHRLDIPWPQAMQGSSPHTRGAQADNIGATAKQRIIPAYAGSTLGCP